MSDTVLAVVIAVVILGAPFLLTYLGFLMWKRRKQRMKKQKKKLEELGINCIEAPPIEVDNSFNDKSLTGGFYM